jgi:glycosyltransferase involved in cell wall biosynthesis
MAMPIAVMWEHFGPYHHDRIRALVEADIPVVAIQLFGRSATYSWQDAAPPSYPLLTLAESEQGISTIALARKLVRAVRESGVGDCFFCHYEYPAVLIASARLRLAGHRVFTMLDSKYDDYPRRASRERVKRAFLLPYRGALAGSERSRDYLSGLGIGRERTCTGFDTVDIARLARQGRPARDIPFAERAFLIVARLVPKKNVAGSLRAFARYRREHPGKRRLEILGDGPLRSKLEALAAQLGIADWVDFRGNVSSEQVSETMRRSLALLLPSTSEQFGLVVNEAFANALPAIVSHNCGAVDILVRDGRNGFVIDPRSEDELVEAMKQIGSDETAWHRLSAQALTDAPLGDVRHFVEGVRALTRDG